MVIRMGRYGKFLACSGYPECRNTKQIAGESDSKDKKELELTDEKCELCDAPLAVRNGRYVKFLSCSKYPECNYIKKKNYGIGIKCPECQEGEVVSRNDLLDVVWGYEVFPTTRTVDNFVARIRKQIEDKPAKPKHILSVRSVGYKLVT